MHSRCRDSKFVVEDNVDDLRTLLRTYGGRMLAFQGRMRIAVVIVVDLCVD
jgi:hypothetical protein